MKSQKQVFANRQKIIHKGCTSVDNLCFISRQKVNVGVFIAIALIVFINNDKGSIFSNFRKDKILSFIHFPVSSFLHFNLFQKLPIQSHFCIFVALIGNVYAKRASIWLSLSRAPTRYISIFSYRKINQIDKNITHCS